MRNIQAERLIRKKLTLNFGLDPARFDVTVIGDECTFSGKFVIKTSGKTPDDIRMSDIKRFFAPGHIEGVNTYYYELRG